MSFPHKYKITEIQNLIKKQENDMYFELITKALSHIFWAALHITSGGTFPKPLSAKEEKECLDAIAAGDMEARNKLVEHNLRLVAHIVKKYYTISDEHDDLISIGVLGLMKAANTFKTDKNVRFASYASRCIENEILMSFRVKKKRANDISISDPIDTDHDGNNLSLGDVLAVEQDMVEILDKKENNSKLYKLVQSKLSGREREIISLRYGLYNTVPLTQREVADAMKISRSYVSRLEKKAINTLKNHFEK